MVLTINSLVAAARHKTLRAKRHIELAKADLHEANKQLEQAIPLGDTEDLIEAHEQTQHAEEEVSKAAQELQVAEQLLVQQVSHTGASGEGVESAMQKLSTDRPKMD